MRQRRRALSARERRRCAEKLAAALRSSPVYRRARTIACYLPADGEIDTAVLMHHAHADGKHIYLPVVPRQGRGSMRFREYHAGSLLVPNRYGIAEPSARGNRPLAPRRLDLVLAPLVAFDSHGNRLGMGGGYYDRSFAFLHHRRHWQRPRIIGVGYSFQEVSVLPAEPWDVPLWGVLTECGFRSLPRKLSQ